MLLTVKSDNSQCGAFTFRQSEPILQASFRHLGDGFQSSLASRPFRHESLQPAPRGSREWRRLARAPRRAPSGPRQGRPRRCRRKVCRSFRTLLRATAEAGQNFVWASRQLASSRSKGISRAALSEYMATVLDIAAARSPTSVANVLANAERRSAGMSDTAERSSAALSIRGRAP